VIARTSESSTALQFTIPGLLLILLGGFDQQHTGAPVEPGFTEGSAPWRQDAEAGLGIPTRKDTT
jgi:hypothetical protein